MYITIRPSDKDRDFMSRGKVHADFIDFLKQFYVGYSYELNVWRMEEPDWEATTRDVCTQGWWRLVYPTGLYNWFSNIYLLLNVEEGSDLYNLVWLGGDTTLDELYEWFEERELKKVPMVESIGMILYDATTGEQVFLEEFNKEDYEQK